MTAVSLSYSPAWYLTGDPNNFVMAIAYGSVSMTLIWTLEAVSHRVLSSNGCFISTSEAAKLLTFHTQYLLQLGRWFFFFTAKSFPRLNRRALAGLFLRVLILVVDCAIIFALTPRRIPVFEDEVGSSQISFTTGTSLETSNYLGQLIGADCVSDKTRYSGFAALVIREIWVNLHTTSFSSPNIAEKRHRESLDVLRNYPDNSEIYYFSSIPGKSLLRVYAVEDQVHYDLAHQIVNITGDTVPLRLPLPDDITKKLFTGC